MAKALAYYEDGAERFVAQEASSFDCTLNPLSTSSAIIEGDKMQEFLLHSQTASQLSYIVLKTTADTLQNDLQAVKWQDLFNDKAICKVTNKFNAEYTQAVVKSLQEAEVAISLSKAQVIVRIWEDKDIIYIGLDMSAKPLYKREYKIFNNPAALRATVGFQALLFADYTPDKFLVDPMCGGGTIPIEASLKANNIPPHEIDNLCCKYWKFWDYKSEEVEADEQIIAYDWNITAVKAAQKNASIAGVAVPFVRYEVEFLPHKCENETVDCIVTNPPAFNKRDVKKKLHKTMKQLLDAADMVLKENGKLVVVTNKPDELLELLDEDLDLIHKDTVSIKTGQAEQQLVLFEKQ